MHTKYNCQVAILAIKKNTISMLLFTCQQIHITMMVGWTDEINSLSVHHYYFIIFT